jgi:hypothetical protein
MKLKEYSKYEAKRLSTTTITITLFIVGYGSVP